MTMPRTNAAGGFTIIELMITIVIASILLTLAVPSFQGFIANQRVKTDANLIFMSMLYARSEAIKRNSAVSVAATGGDWATGWSVVDDGGVTLRAHDALSDVAVTSDENTVTFARNGRLTTASPTLTLCDSNNKATRRKLTIDVSGQPKLELDGSCAS